MKNISRSTWITIAVCTLGYFVDIFDLVLFSIVRVPSLKSIGVSGDELLNIGVFLLNMQMVGMLVGGVIWGVLGDKRGRVSVLFGSILMYSLANIANAFVTNDTQYGILRFIAGVGLAGELGAAITLVSEIMSKEARGYGATIVAGVGLSGAVAAGVVGDLLSWKASYIVGGVLGLALLVLRVGIFESGLFEKTKESNAKRGDFLMLFYPWERFKRYLSCILIGLPVWSVVGVLVTFAPEICPELGIKDPVSAGKGIMHTYMGVTVGDICAGLFSQMFKNRRAVVAVYLVLVAICVFVTLFAHYESANTFYLLCIAMGFATGYWAVFTAVAAEQFGTNLRATATITIPNFVRSGVVPLTLLFRALKPHIATVNSVLIVVGVCITAALVSLWNLEETYGKDLNYLEH